MVGNNGKQRCITAANTGFVSGGLMHIELWLDKKKKQIFGQGF